MILVMNVEDMSRPAQSLGFWNWSRYPTIEPAMLYWA
jgi:hypothetical protein